MAAPELSISPAYVELLLAKMRAAQGKDGEVVPDDGSNAADDGMTDALQDHPNDPQREEVREEIIGLNERQKAELVALMWVGRGDAEAEEWDSTVAMAMERKESPTETYLMKEPLVAEHIAEGMERIGVELAPIEVEAEDSRAE